MVTVNSLIVPAQRESRSGGCDLDAVHFQLEPGAEAQIRHRNDTGDGWGAPPSQYCSVPAGRT
jgi:hypothetical protein